MLDIILSLAGRKELKPHRPESCLTQAILLTWSASMSPLKLTPQTENQTHGTHTAQHQPMNKNFPHSIAFRAPSPTSVSLGRLGHTLCTPGSHARPEGRSRSRASSGSPPPPWRRRSEGCCRGTSGGPAAQPWTRRAGHSPRSGTGAPLQHTGWGQGHHLSLHPSSTTTPPQLDDGVVNGLLLNNKKKRRTSKERGIPKNAL